MYPQSLQDPKMGGSRLAKMADEEEELGTSGHEVEHPPMAGGAGEKGDDEESRVRRSLMLRSAVCREGTVQRVDVGARRRSAEEKLWGSCRRGCA